jgi:hypothetical protein
VRFEGCNCRSVWRELCDIFNICSNLLQNVYRLYVAGTKMCLFNTYGKDSGRCYPPMTTQGVQESEKKAHRMIGTSKTGIITTNVKDL